MFEKIDLTLKMNQDSYNKQLTKLQIDIVNIQQILRTSKKSVVVIYEGWDASGKGGSILRITERMDPRMFQVWSIGAPNDVENKYNYLWRFWSKMPAAGKVGIFDRSWYGRVLVERVEKFAQPDEWKRAYDEINSFENFIIDNGTILIKFWMHISKDEQLKRFNQRETDPLKKWKITQDDWRNREKWDEYYKAAEMMFKKTNTSESPWHIISAEDKKNGRIETLKTVVKSLSSTLGI